jgi:hypothetical protein
VYLAKFDKSLTTKSSATHTGMEGKYCYLVDEVKSQRRGF